MKNCELFTTVRDLCEAWARREQITKGLDEEHKYTPKSILDWACFRDADTALDPKLKPGTLVKLTGISLMRYPAGSLGIVVRPIMGCLSQPIVKLIVKMADGRDAEIEAAYLTPSELPAEVLQLARNQIAEEAKASCPLYKKES